MARHIGQCTKFGRLLDIATDVASKTVFIGCFAAAELNSTTLPAFLTGYGFWICLLVYRRFDTVGCFICISIVFLGACWKDIRYPCSVTRWYYETSVGGYSVYTSYHIFFAALYLAAEVNYDNVGYILASTCLPSFLIRRWTGVVISLELMRTMMLIVKADHSSNHSSNCRLDCLAHAEGEVENLWKMSAFLGGLA